MHASWLLRALLSLQRLAIVCEGVEEDERQRFIRRFTQALLSGNRCTSISLG